MPLAIARRAAWGPTAACSRIDQALLGFAETAVDEVPDSVTELINDTTDDEPCLFDRTSEWRLSPARKFNWWFGSTNDRTWLLAAGS